MRDQGTIRRKPAPRLPRIRDDSWHARSAASKLWRSKDRPTLSRRAICLATSEIGLLSSEQLIGPGRKQHYCYWRQVAMVAMRQSNYSFCQAGAWFGRDHTTVINAVKRVKHNGAEVDVERVLALARTKVGFKQSLPPVVAAEAVEPVIDTPKLPALPRRASVLRAPDWGDVHRQKPLTIIRKHDPEATYVQW